MASGRLAAKLGEKGSKRDYKAYGSRLQVEPGLRALLSVHDMHGESVRPFYKTCDIRFFLQFELDVGILRLAIPLYTYKSLLAFSLLILLYCAFT